MKSQKRRFLPRFMKFMLFLAVGCMAVSCGDDDVEPTTPTDPISSFQFAISDSDWRVVEFSNFSDNATSYSWDFGDTNTSTEESPTHTYAEAGTYDVTLTATNSASSKTSTKTISISDPNEAIKQLTGDVSKTWKLFREGTSMSVGPDIDNAGQWWSGLTNDGTRPCLYEQEFTFHLDGTYEIDDKGMFWAEFGVFNNVDGCTQNSIAESCFDATAASMINACGDDVSAWLSGTHSFEYDPSTSSLTLNGNGAWLGIPKLATTATVLVPQPTVTTKVTFEQFTGYDLMLVEYIYEGEYWPITYVSYSDASLEPALVTEAGEFGEDLVDISPSELSRTFASADAADWVLLDTIGSGSSITFGVANPDGSADLVGEFQREATDYQELQMQTAPDKNDINFENLTTITLDVYFPSSNDYSTTLTKDVVIGFGDRSQTEQWWTALIEYKATDLAEDTWNTISFQLNDPSPSSSVADQTPFDRNDLDMVYIGIGGSGHPVPGTFYIRNFKID